jgi:radical SAM protein with 4Fe4S-binding SPASM domain
MAKLFEVEKNLWFDSERFYIVKDKENYKSIFDQKSEKLRKDQDNLKKIEKSVTIVFLSAKKCNLKCSYCYAEQGNYPGIKEQKEMFEFDDYVEVYHKIKSKFDVESICFFGGEPLLNFKTIKRFVEYLYDNFEAVQIPKIGIASNGTIMNKEIYDFLVKYKILLATSLDGPRELNDICRKGDFFSSVHDKVLDNLSYFEAAEIKPIVQFTFNKHHVNNYKEVTSWLKYFESLPISDYAIIAATTEDKNSKIDLKNTETKEKFILMCENIADYCLNNLTKKNSPLTPSLFASLIVNLSKRQKTGVCAAGQSITVSPSRKFYPCHVMANTPENSVECVDNFDEKINENAKFVHVKNLKREDVENCKVCIAKNICAVFCKGMCKLDGGKLFHPEERCLMMRIFLKRTISFLSNKNFNKNTLKENLLKFNKRNLAIYA